MLPGDEEGMNDSKKCCNKKTFTHSGGISNRIFEQQSNFDTTEGSRFSGRSSWQHRSTWATNHVASDLKPIQPRVLSATLAISWCPGKAGTRLPAMTLLTAFGCKYHDPIQLLFLSVCLLPEFAQPLLELLQTSCNHRRSFTFSVGVQCVTASTEQHVGGGKHDWYEVRPEL